MPKRFQRLRAEKRMVAAPWLDHFFSKYMGVSKNSGTPKSSHFNRVFHYISSILGTLIFGNTYIGDYTTQLGEDYFINLS